jgi:hypothetical protein
MSFSTTHNVIDYRIQHNKRNSLGFILLDFKSNQKRELIKHTSKASINQIDQDFNQKKTQIQTSNKNELSAYSSNASNIPRVNFFIFWFLNARRKKRQ